MINIALVSKGGTYWLGGNYYIKNLIYCLNTLPEREDLNIFLLIFKGEEKIYEDVKSLVDKIVNIDEHLAPFNIQNRIRWKLKREFTKSFNPRLEEFLIKENINIIYPSLVRQGTSSHFSQLEWIPDFQYLHFPEGSNINEIHERKTEFGRIAQYSPFIILSSSMAETDCHKEFPQSINKTHVLKFKVFITDEQLSGSFNGVQGHYNIPNKYFLISNLIAPTKNHILVLKALVLLKEKGISPNLVLTGSAFDYRNPNFFNKILEFIHCNNLHNQVKILGIIPKQDQITLMRNSMAVIQPSRFEGWHTGVEECKFLGKKVILSDIPVHVEQNPENGLFFKDNDEFDLSEKITMFLNTDPVSFDEKTEKEHITKYKSDIQEYARFFLNIPNSQK